MDISDDGSEHQHLLDEDDSNTPKNESFKFFVLNNIKRTIPTILSYDNDLGLPVLGIMITHRGFPDAAPIITTMLNTMLFLQYANVMPASFELGQLFGELSADKDNIALKNKISRVPRNGVIAGLLSAPAIFAMIYASPLLSALGQSDDMVANPSYEFFKYFWPFFLAFSPRLLMEFVLLTFEKQNAAMIIALCSLAVTITVQYILGFETSLGLSGLGLGNGSGVLLTAIGFTMCVAYHFHNEYSFFKKIFAWDSSDWQAIGTLIKESGPIVFTGVSDVSVAFVITLIAGLLRGDALKIQNIATQYLNMNALITAAGSQTLGIVAAEQRGRAKVKTTSYDSIQVATKAGLLATFILQLPFMLFICIFPDVFSKIVGTTIKSETLRHLLLITAAYSCVDGARLNILQATRSIGDNAIPSLISSILLWVGAGISYILSHHTSLGILGLPLGLLIGSLSGTVILKNRLNKSIIFAMSTDESSPTATDGPRLSPTNRVN